MYTELKTIPQAMINPSFDEQNNWQNALYEDSPTGRNFTVGK